MNQLTKWAAVLCAVAGISLVSSAWSPTSNGSTGSTGSSSSVVQGRTQGKQVGSKARAEKLATLKKAITELKTPLSEAITLVEKETNGKGYAAEVMVGKQGKVELEVGFLDQEGNLTRAVVDPITKKVTVNKPKREKGASEAGGESEGEDEGGGEEEDESEDGG